MRKNLEKEELLTNKKKKQISEEFITDNRLERRKRRIKKELISESSHQKYELHFKSPEYASFHQSKSYTDVAREVKFTSLGNLNIRDIYLDLMNDESNNLSSIEITPPQLSTNSTEMLNSSNSLEKSTPESQDRELFSILDDLQNVSVTGPSNNTDNTRLTGYFCSETVFNLSNRVLVMRKLKFWKKDWVMRLYGIRSMNQN